MSVGGARALLQPSADVSPLYEVYVVLIVAARPHQDAQEVQVIAQVLHERRPLPAERQRKSNIYEECMYLKDWDLTIKKSMNQK